MPLFVAYYDMEMRYKYINLFGAHWLIPDAKPDDIIGNIAYGHERVVKNGEYTDPFFTLLELALYGFSTSERSYALHPFTGFRYDVQFHFMIDIGNNDEQKGVFCVMDGIMQPKKALPLKGRIPLSAADVMAPYKAHG